MRKSAGLRVLAGTLAVAWALSACNKEEAVSPGNSTVSPVEQTAEPELSPLEVVYTKNAPGSYQANAIAAFDTATDVEVISLLPWDVGAYFDKRRKIEPNASASERVRRAFEAGEHDRQRHAQAAWCQPGPCIEGNRVLGAIRVTSPERMNVLRATLTGWYETSPDYGVACASEYHHAIAFTSEGKRYQVLLCYHCGQYTILVDGVPSPESQAAHAIGLNELNAWLGQAGIPFDVPEQ
jgi:hypothetical protein